MPEIVSSYQSLEDRDRSSSSPESVHEILRQALALHNENRLDVAVAHYREVLELEPGHPDACFNLGTIFHSSGDLPGAISYYRQFLDREPENFQTLYLLANALREHGCTEEAIINYQQAIAADHTYAEAHYNLGIVYYHQGEYERAMACYREAINIEPSHADSLYNIGLIYFEMSDYDKAAASYEKALAVRPADVDTLYNLAFTRARQGQLAEAALHYHAATELAPDDAELHNSLGSILRKLNEPEMAEACYRQAVRLRPDYGSAWTNLATILQILGQYDEALECYSKAIEFGDQTESADYMMAALTGSNRQNPPHSYVRNLYDSFAESFEKNLVGNLEYKAPELLKKVCIEIKGETKRFKRAVDVGCGTGLTGEHFRDVVDDLTGVDISDKMLAKARDKQIYDRLFCSDIIDFLEEESAPDLDLVVAADVLIYLGRLEPFFSSLRKQMASGGYLLFSTEKLDSDGDYSLLRTGRYAHSENYIRSLARDNGFKVDVCEEVKLRKEKDKWLSGFVFGLRFSG